MKFKHHFRIFTLAWAVTVLTVSDILLVSLFRSIDFNIEDPSPVPAMILVPAAFAAAGRLLIEVFSRLLVKRLRRHYLILEGVTEYAFFRNFVLLLAAGAAANTVLLYTRYRSVTELLIKEEERRIRLMHSSEPAYLEQCLDTLARRISTCDTAAVIITVLLVIVKAAAYLFLARGLVRTYHKNVHTAYSQEVHP